MNSEHSSAAPMTPHAFIKKWKAANLTERQTSHEHFLDLCSLLNHPTPTQSDPTGDHFAFEKGANKIGGGRGFADVWKKDHFAWEYKRRDGDLDKALLQLIRYAPALESPPLHVVCDVERFEVHTAWTNTVPKTYALTLDELAEPERLDILRCVFHDPEQLRPTKSRASLTAEAADKFSDIALRLRNRGPAEDVAHFVNQLVFCFFANSTKLLPDGLFPKLLKRAAQQPEKAQTYFNQLFAAMESGGDFDLNDIAWFNGGLFDGRRAFALDEGDVGLLLAAGSMDWSQIDPIIFGTLFERFLDPDKRAQIGAHYTDAEKISKIVEPVVLRPLREEWKVARTEIEGFLSGAIKPPMRAKLRRYMKPLEAAEEARSRYLERLRKIQILDPACGSGNFLYLALQGVKDIENKTNLECEMLGLESRLPVIGPEIVRGLEINPLAAELARTTIWIGDIQWRLRNGIYAKPQPILRKLDAIECRDALLTNSSGSFEEARWPDAEFIVGNPPFLGDKKIAGKLDKKYVDALRQTYAGRVGGNVDLVCHWFEKSLDLIKKSVVQSVGLVSTNSIKRGANRTALDRISSVCSIFEAWSDEKWVLDGAAIRVALICFGKMDNPVCRLDGKVVPKIHSDLTGGNVDITKAKKLTSNRSVSFLGIQKSGPLDVSGDIARQWLSLPLNPNGLPNASVLRPYWNGDDVTALPRDRWLIDLPRDLKAAEAALFQEPFEYLKSARYQDDDPEDLRTLQQARAEARDKHARERWWEPYWPRPEMRQKIAGLRRYIVTPETPTYTLFAWLPSEVVPDKNLIVIIRDDDTFFGILHSHAHLLWVRALGSPYGNHPTARRYNSSRVFETFPFPDGLTPDVPAQNYANDPRARDIATAAKRLDELRNAWLRPPDLINILPEVVAGYPERIVPKNAEAALEISKRTLTNLYNLRPQWLLDAHHELDVAVAAAYGWASDISNDEVLAKLLALNLERQSASKLSQPRASSAQRRGSKTVTPEELRAQPQFKYPIPGGKAAKKEKVVQAAPPRRSSKRRAKRAS